MSHNKTLLVIIIATIFPLSFLHDFWQSEHKITFKVSEAHKQSKKPQTDLEDQFYTNSRQVRKRKLVSGDMPR